MTKRELYMSGQMSHHKYYTEMALQAKLFLTTTFLQELSEVEWDTSKIELYIWDAKMDTALLHEVMKEYGDFYSKAGNVCVYKALAEYKSIALMSHEHVRRMVEKNDKENTVCMVPYSFVEEMCDCVPPETMRDDGYYQIIQVGEITRHTSAGVPLYETYMCMSEKAEAENLADSRMIQNEWYFMGMLNKTKEGK